jgi:hypothetical protein
MAEVDCRPCETDDRICEALFVSEQSSALPLQFVFCGVT